uniref:EVE domain-containing protein n=2 Tax=environmental samples TaxID=651140 RepID=A0A075FPC1_9ARCH|nr:hypothetical protein [uncultured marine thaumarchaeote AD1000_36_B08]AIF23072.1 hypothetical protein [uncultured marine thaumarchaeote SAT1000_12_G09]
MVFFYHTGDERQVVGIMTVISKPYPNPKEDNERFVVVDVKFKKLLKKSNHTRLYEKTKAVQRLGVITNFKIICNACSKINLGSCYKDVSKIIRT